MSQEKGPLYPRLLQLKNIHPNAWQRAVLGEGMAILAALLVMADLASAWSILVLPLAMAAVVKGHDIVAGLLADEPEEPAGHEEPEDSELVAVRMELEAVRRELDELLREARGEPART